MKLFLAGCAATVSALAFAVLDEPRGAVVAFAVALVCFFAALARGNR